MTRFTKHALGTVVFALTSAAIVVAHAANITGHRAFYEMRMGQSDKNAVVQSVSGRSAFVLEKDCDGWRSAEDYMIEFGNGDGRTDRIISHFESWESDSGEQYSFDIAEKSSFQDDKNFSGYAEINANGGEAVFMLDGQSNIALPENTYFPMQHIRAIINKAGDGSKILAASVFAGAEPDDALLTTNTVIGGWQGGKADVELGALDGDGFWPIQIAFFKPSATEVEPEYEIHYWLQPNGVVRQYEINYGDFSIVAGLVTIETVDTPVCQ
ncbi:MAG: EipB family protein [Candidatus Puniceispirillaceae bacterium]